MKLIDHAMKLSKFKHGWEKLPNERRKSNILTFSCPGNWMEGEEQLDRYGNCKYEGNCEECWNREC